MSYYSRTELELKSYDKLFELAKKEKLIDVYSIDNTKKELIELILKYRGIENQYIISNFLEEGFLKLQQLFDDNFSSHEYIENDIEIPRKLIFYEDIKVKKEDEYVILISKNLNICENIVLLIGKNNYIYGFLYLKRDDDYSDNRYIKYYLCHNNISRYKDTNINSEVVFLVFFDEYMCTQIYNSYYDIKMNLKQKNIVGYKVLVYQFIFNKSQYTKDICPIIFEDNKVITPFFSVDFNMYIYDVSDNNFRILYFDDVNKLIEKYEYNILGTHIYDINELLSKENDKIKIFDNLGMNKIVSNKELQEKFISKIKEKITYYSKKIYSDYYIISKNVDILGVNKISELLAINYTVISKKLNKISGGYISDKYLIISSNHANIDISVNEYEIIEKDINYDININTVVSSNNNNINYELIIRRIMLLVKYKICDMRYKKISTKEIFTLIDNGNYDNYLKENDKDYEALENIYPTDYIKNKNRLNTEYIKIYKNYIKLRDTSSNIFDEYINSEEKYIFEYDYYIDSINKNKKIIISRYEIELIFTLEIYNFLNNFFTNYNLINILSEYKGITLSGSIVKTRVFYNILKEFIPGKLITYDTNNRNTSYLLDAVIKYINDTNKGVINCKFNIIYEKKEITLYIKNFKDIFDEIYDSSKMKIGYTDKIENSSFIEIKIKNKKNNKEKIKIINIPDINIEIDEKYINIEQIHLNSIENGIIRIFFYFEKTLKIVFIKRYKDQIFMSNEIKFDINF